MHACDHMLFSLCAANLLIKPICWESLAMNLREILQAGILLSSHVIGGLMADPDIRMRPSDESQCEPRCDNSAGKFCKDKECISCSPCPDPYSPRFSPLTVVTQCAENGYCPNVCHPLWLEDNIPRANDTFCKNLPVTNKPVVTSPTWSPTSTVGVVHTTPPWVQESTTKFPNEVVTEDLPSSQSSYVPIVVVVAAFSVVLCVVVIIFIVKKLMRCDPQYVSIIESEAALHELEVDKTTHDSITVQVKDASRSKKSKRLFCKKAGSADGEQEWSETLTWDVLEVLPYEFSGLDPGSEYTVSLQEKVGWSCWKTLASKTATTKLIIELSQDGRSAIVKGLLKLQCSALEVCPCLHPSDDRNWIELPSGVDEFQLPARLTPGLVYTVKAGTTSSVQGKQMFQEIIDGILDTTGITGDSTQVCSTTVGEVLVDVTFRKSLEIELNGMDQHYMPELVAGAFNLTGDDLKSVKNSTGHHLDLLYEILDSKFEHPLHTSVHNLMEHLVEYREAHDFIRKLAKRDRVSLLHCSTCLQLLHQAHSR